MVLDCIIQLKNKNIIPGYTHTIVKKKTFAEYIYKY